MFVYLLGEGLVRSILKTDQSNNRFYSIIENFSRQKPLTAARFRLLCSGYESRPPALWENSEEELLFLRTQIQDFEQRGLAEGVLTAPGLTMQASSIRSVVDTGLLGGVEVVNKREGFYLQFAPVSLREEEDCDFESEKFVYE